MAGTLIERASRTLLPRVRAAQRGRDTSSRAEDCHEHDATIRRGRPEAAMTDTMMPSRFTPPRTRRAEVLVSTDWVADHANDSSVRVVEVDVDTSAYDKGHVPGAFGWNWTTQLCDTLVRDIVPRRDLEALLGATGIRESSTVVLYGDNSNWFAAWAFWQLKIYGQRDVRIMDGGRKKWLEEGRPLTPEL